MNRKLGILFLINPLLSCSFIDIKEPDIESSIAEDKLKLIISEYSSTDQYSKYGRIKEVLECEDPPNKDKITASRQALYSSYVDRIGEKFEACNYQIVEKAGNEISRVYVIETCTSNICQYEFSQKVVVIVEDVHF